MDFTISGGIMEVQPHIVTILADAAENVQEIDVARAEAAKKRMEDILKQGPPPDMDSYLAMEAALKRSNLRLEAARRYRGPRSSISGQQSAGESGGREGPKGHSREES
jgi:F-type H+-transporting ATPase subunit epsilon